ncbi:PepSY-associated TM helix domain-containing protein [Pseudobacteriovorax antillogorgiicola]|uniref:Uncharacterized iron-regulated membrane protein n=1 Tax=Pseudobacteriovorax antillogorgiicola TaxID=1513793 RepID=A0A1Y6CPU9_9BACT|nr:PepSY-associated TM helix domain-containing protein [Pseudobacteriovorax antillogorgiicola]TCS43612.1 putative iron-regulated membrane protein [Pseudobacteriovorax antillogorgiicola]SMF80072.1 Uncharacterized iron-regulated membrane protein [Pseudobacteriovorax antillogorgiicola]
MNRVRSSAIKIHRGLGLFVALNMLVMILTGTVLVFRSEIEGQAASPSQAPQLQPEHLEHALALGHETFPKGNALAVFLDDHDPDRLSLRLGKDGSTKFRGAHRVAYSLSQETLLSSTSSQEDSSWLTWVLDLHRNFLMGSTGELYVSLIGILYLIVLVLGFVIYGPYARRLGFGHLRSIPSKPKVWWLDFHKFLGTSIFAWSVLIGFTGVCLGLGDQLIKYYQVTELQSLEERHQESYPQDVADVSVGEAFAKAREATNGRLSFLAWPGTQFAIQGHFLILMETQDGWAADVKLVLIDRKNGEVDEVRSLPWFLRVLVIAEPLHFGNYGGTALKVVWAILGLSSLLAPLSGLLFWYLKRRPRTRLHPREHGVQKGFLIGRAAYLIPTVLLALGLLGVFLTYLSSGMMQGLGLTLVASPFVFILYSLGMSLRSRG